MMVDEEPIKLTLPQRKLLIELETSRYPKHVWPTYQPLVKLAELGFAESACIIPDPLGTKWRITDQGRAWLRAWRGLP